MNTFRARIATLLLCFCGPAFAAAQLSLPQPGVVADVGVATVEAIDQELASVNANTELDDSNKASLTELLQRGKKSLTQTQSNGQLTRQYQQWVDTAASQLAEIQSKLDAAGKGGDDSKVSQYSSDSSLTDLSSRLATVTSELNDANKSVSTLSAEPTRRRTRMAEIPELISAAQSELDNLQDQLSQPTASNESEQDSRIRRMVVSAKVEELKSRIDALRGEQAAYSATTELLPLQQKLAETTAQRLRREAETLQQLINAKQQEKIQKTAQQLRQTAKDVPEKLKDLAQKNYALSQSRKDLLEKSAAAEKRLLDVQATAEQVRAQRKIAEERIDDVGLTDALDLLLRQQRDQAESLRYQYRPQPDLRKTTREYQIDIFEMEDELGTIAKELEATPAPDVDWQSESIDWEQLSITDARWILLRKRRQLLEETLQTQNAVLNTMLVSDTERRILIGLIDDFTAFIDQHLFWTRSAPVVSLSEIETAGQAAAWFVDPAKWQRLLYQMILTAKLQPANSVMLTLLVVTLIMARPRFRSVIRREGEAATKVNATFRSTLVTLISTGFDSLVWPSVFAACSYLALGTPSADPFVRGMGKSFAGIAIFISSRELLRHACRKNGLAEMHFGWSEAVRTHVRRHLRWYTLLGAISVIPLATFHQHTDPNVRAFATRFASTSLFLLTAWFHHLMLRTGSPIYTQLIRHNPDSRIYRFRKLLWSIAVLMPTGFAVMALAGYLETTYRLGRSLQTTFLLLVATILLAGLLSRFLMLRKRDLARKKAMEARAKRSAEGDKGEAAIAANEAGIVLHDEIEIDLDALDTQTRRSAVVVATTLALIGLAYIWRDLVPALAYLNEIECWSVGSEDNLQIVSLRDVLYAAIALAGTIYATGALPPMFEFLVLGRTSLDSGARYAIVTLMRYGIIVLGFLILFNLLSVPYNQLGWLLAGVSVGLGFGLQEIVANFVCGIILLLERPVRVGDIVTIDDTTGIVSRIQMRATTVTNWDRKELVIPNKDLITQKLLNWSLSNLINRLTLEVGVAYGSDPDQVRSILYRVVSEHPDVLKDPPPLINFETFGDSSLNFVMRFFLEKLDNRIETTHQINSAIAREFQRAGIEIPFPQRDLHIDFSERPSVEVTRKASPGA